MNFPSTSTRDGPQRSPLPKGAETVVVGGPRVGVEVASTKSAPQRSGDGGRDARRPGSPASLNEVRSPKERRQAARRRGTPRVWRLNEVRSPKERRQPLRREHTHRRLRASTKSAPQRSGDVADRWGTRGAHTPQRSPLPKGAETRMGRSAWTRRCSLNEVRSPKERRQHLRLQPFDMGRRDLRRALGSRGIREAPCLSASAHKPWADKPFSDATARRIPDIDGAFAKVPGSLQMMMGPSTEISRDRPRKLNCSAPSVAVRPRSQTSTLSSPGSSTASRAACRETNWAGKASTTKTEYWTRSPNPSRTRAARDLRRSSGMS